MQVFRCARCGGFNRVAAGKPGAPVCGRCRQRLDVENLPQPVDAVAFRHAVDSSPIPVLVDFWAPWCGPCRMAAPILEKIARAEAGQVLVLKVNSDENPSLSSEFGIRGIPAFLMFKDGAERDRLEGLPNASQFAEWVRARIA